MNDVLGKLFAKKKLRTIDIGPPTDMRQNIHVTKNPETGNLEGLPKSWSKLWNTQSSAGELTKEPVECEASQTKFYVAIDDKAPEDPSKLSLAEVKKEEDLFKKCGWSTA